MERRCIARKSYHTGPAPLPRPVLGSTVMCVPYIEGEENNVPQPATVVYINEKHRWYRVRFPYGIHQCYQWGTTK